MHIHETSVIFLVVQGVMFQAHGSAIVLGTTCVSHRQRTTQQGVFTQIFISSPSRGDTLDVDGWSQNHVLATHSGLAAHTLPIGISPLYAPSGRQCRTRRKECGGVVRQVQGIPRMRFHLLTYAKGAVSIFHVGNTQPGDTFRGKHVFPVKHRYLLFKTHARDNRLYLLFVVHQARGILLGRRC